MTSRRARRANVISAEALPLEPGLAPPSTAFTFAQTVKANGKLVTLLVTAFDGETIEAIDLTELGAPADVDVFEASSKVGDDRLLSALGDQGRRARYDVSNLAPSGARFDRHLATGTNFAEHARESGMGTVFNFPKYGEPTPARTTLAVHPGTLMDYEVEISVRFDRDVRSMQDFADARKGFFLCGDFTDRVTLVRGVNPKNIASGHGFSDSKSGPDFFPTGPFLVIPHDWRDFVKNERIITKVNGELKQDARGGEMILDFEALVAKALENGHERAWMYGGKPVPLLEDGVIARGAAVMSGTSEGVIFMPPMPEDKIQGIADHILRGRFLRGRPLLRSVAERFIDNERRADRYLKVGDVVEHASSSMGALAVRLVRG